MRVTSEDRLPTPCVWLSPLAGRPHDTCREPAQKWQLAAACFKHCQLVLAALASSPPNYSMQGEGIRSSREHSTQHEACLGAHARDRPLLPLTLLDGWHELLAAGASLRHGPPTIAHPAHALGRHVPLLLPNARGPDIPPTPAPPPCCNQPQPCAELMARPPPGMLVLLDLMGGKQLEKALLQHVLGPGFEHLEVRAQGP